MAYTGATANTSAGVQTNDTSLLFRAEARYGAVDPGAWQAVRFTSEGFKPANSRIRPQEIFGSGRQDLKNYESAQAHTAQMSVTATINGAFSAQSFDDFISSVMGADFTEQEMHVFQADEAPLTWSANPRGDTKDPAVTLTLPVAVAATWYQKHGRDGVVSFRSSQLFGNWRYRADAQGNTIALWPLFLLSAPTVALEAVEQAASMVVHSSVSPGNTVRTFSFMEKFKSNSYFYILYPGQYITSASISFSQGQFATCVFDLEGQAPVKIDADFIEQNVTEIEAAPDTFVFSDVSDFECVTLNSFTPSACIVELTLALSRDGAGQDFGMCSSSARGQRPGTLTPMGTISMFFNDKKDYDMFLQDTPCLFSARVRDAQGRGYFFVFPNSRLQNPQINATAKNATVLATFDIEGNPVDYTTAAGPSLAGGSFIIARIV